MKISYWLLHLERQVDWAKFWNDKKREAKAKSEIIQIQKLLCNGGQK